MLELETKALSCEKQIYLSSFEKKGGSEKQIYLSSFEKKGGSEIAKR